MLLRAVIRLDPDAYTPFHAQEIRWKRAPAVSRSGLKTIRRDLMSSRFEVSSRVPGRLLRQVGQLPFQLCEVVTAWGSPLELDVSESYLAIRQFSHLGIGHFDEARNYRIELGTVFWPIEGVPGFLDLADHVIERAHEVHSWPGRKADRAGFAVLPSDSTGALLRQ